MKKQFRFASFGALLLGTLPIILLNGHAAAQSLEEEAEQLLKKHPQILAAQKSISSSQEAINTAAAGYMPVVSASGDFGYERIDSPGRTSATPDQGPFTTGQSRQASVTVTQTVFNGFLTDADNETAKLAKRSAEISVEEVSQNILFEGVSVYLEVLRNLRLLKLSIDNEATIQKQLELEDERVRRGSGIALDVLESKRRLQGAKERRVAFDGALRDSRSRFNQVFGHEPVVEDMIIPTPPLSLLPESLENAKDMAIKLHPAIRNAEKRIDIAQQARKIAKAGFFPTVDIVGEWGYEDDFGGTRGGRRDFSAKVKANWDIFNGFATEAGVDRAAYDYLASIDSSTFVKRKILEETRLAWSALDIARQRVTLLQNAVNIAAEVFNGRRKLREAGKETVINVLDSESQMFDARINLVNAQHDARIAVYRLLTSMGQLNLENVSRISQIKPRNKLLSQSATTPELPNVLTPVDNDRKKVAHTTSKPANTPIKKLSDQTVVTIDYNKDSPQVLSKFPTTNEVAISKKILVTPSKTLKKKRTQSIEPMVVSDVHATTSDILNRNKKLIKETELLPERKILAQKPHKQLKTEDRNLNVLPATNFHFSTSKNSFLLSSLETQGKEYEALEDPNFIRIWPYE